MENSESADDTLRHALSRHAISLPENQIEQLDRYARALWAWNEQLNLTRHTDYELFVTRDIVDSLALAELIDESLGKILTGRVRVLDVGTGGGVPGVILAITRPELRVAACESVQKKFCAVQNIVKQLGLSIELFHARAEEVLEVRPFDCLVARAVAPLPKLLYWLAPHWNSIGQLLVVKGRNWPEERRAARERGLLDRLELRRAKTYTTPGADRESFILRIWREAPAEEPAQPEGPLDEI